MKIAVAGCGGVGGVVCAVLVSKGADIICIVSSDESAQEITKRGVKLEGGKGHYDEKIKAYAGFSPALGKFDVIVIAVKCNALRSVFSKAKNYLSENGFILTLQNGLEILNIVKDFPSVRVAGGAVGYNSIRRDYGDYFVTSDGGITIGNLQGVPDEGLQGVKSMFGKEVEISITENIVGVLWSKLFIVCGVTGLGGVSGLLTGELLKQKVARKLFYRIVKEGREVANRSEVHLEPFGGIRTEKFADAKGSYPLFLRWLFLKIMGRKYKNLKSNVQQDLERGKKTEIDWLNGVVVSIGGKVGVETPVNREIVRIVKEIEGHKREMSLDNLQEIWNRISGK